MGAGAHTSHLVLKFVRRFAIYRWLDISASLEADTIKLSPIAALTKRFEPPGRRGGCTPRGRKRKTH